MPTYEYVCHHCGHEFELFQQMSAPVKKKCPECEKPKLKRLIGTGAGVIFKGAGFYETDYRSESYTKAAEAEKKAADGAAKDSPSSKSDSNGSAPKKKEAAASADGGAPARPGGKKSGADKAKAAAST